MEALNIEDQAVAAAVAAMQGDQKRGLEDYPDMAAGFGFKRARVAETVVNQAPAQQEENVMAPYPFFAYKDRSAQEDPDPLLPLTLPGRVPNFPAKMHSILSRTDLADIICWMPHGRGWRVLKPREFEVRVLPTYFEHAKFSSFIRQANGWGFRRITQGRDRNSYYHELFLRGLPHLCKSMKRPGVSKKPASDPDHEPDLYKISERHPLPEIKEDTLMHDCTMNGGPKARMPIYSGTVLSKVKAAAPAPLPSLVPKQTYTLTPHDQQTLSAFEKSLGAAEGQGGLPTTPGLGAQSFQIPSSCFAPAASVPVGFPFQMAQMDVAKKSPLAAANQMAFSNPSLAAAFQASQAATQFAAGFAAAAALSQHQFKSLMDSFASMQPPQEKLAEPMNEDAP